MRSITVRLVAGLLTCALAATASADVIIGGDDFDGGLAYASRTITPDNSANTFPGAFPTSRYDSWGVANRELNRDIADDTTLPTDPFEMDTFGIFSSTKTDNFFVMQDLANNDNASGTAQAEWSFDITGQVNLRASIDVAAIGDFENFRIEGSSEVRQDRFDFTYSIDGGAFLPLFTSTVSDRTNNGGTSVTYTITMDDGDVEDDYYDTFASQYQPFKDPMSMNGVQLDDTLRTISANISGSGSLLTIRLNGESDGDYEVVAFDNLQVSAVPELSACCAMALASVLAGCGPLLRRRPA